jgi:hypothetical protein
MRRDPCQVVRCLGIKYSTEVKREGSVVFKSNEFPVYFTLKSLLKISRVSSHSAIFLAFHQDVECHVRFSIAF